MHYEDVSYFETIVLVDRNENICKNIHGEVHDMFTSYVKSPKTICEDSTIVDSKEEVGRNYNFLSLSYIEPRIDKTQLRSWLIG